MKIGKVSYNYRLVSNRYYNPRISQFYATDPLAEKYPNFSPYTYTADNPVMLVDPNGMDWYKNNGTGETTWFDGKGKQKGYTYLGYFVSETDVDGNKTFYDGATKTKYINGKLEESWDNLNEAVITMKTGNKKKRIAKDLNHTSDVLETLEKRQKYLSENLVLKYGNYGKSASELTKEARLWHVNISKGAKHFGTITMVASSGFEIYSGIEQDGGHFGYHAKKQLTGVISGYSGMLIGEYVGGALFTLIPIPGATYVGILVGGMAGEMLGEYLGEETYEYINEKE